MMPAMIKAKPEKRKADGPRKPKACVKIKARIEINATKPSIIIHVLSLFAPICVYAVMRKHYIKVSYARIFK